MNKVAAVSDFWKWKTNGVDFSSKANIGAIAHSQTSQILGVSVLQTNNSFEIRTLFFFSINFVLMDPKVVQ